MTTVPFDIDPVEVMVSDRWPLKMAPHRAERPEWTTPPHYWEHRRLQRMHDTIEPPVESWEWRRGPRTPPPARRRPVVWDIGAEEGDMPALYASWGADVVLVEPNPMVWPCIRYHWEANDLPDPVGGYVGLVGSHTSDMHAVAQSVGRAWPPSAYGDMTPAHGFHHLREHAEVDAVTTLDDMLDLFPAPDIITADIEGGEGHMLAGAGRMLAEVRPVWFISVHSFELRELYGHNPSEHVHDLMAEFGYTAELLEDRHEGHFLYTP